MPMPAKCANVPYASPSPAYDPLTGEPLQYRIEAARELRQHSKFGIYSPMDRDRVRLVSDFLQSLDTYHLPLNGEWLADSMSQRWATPSEEVQLPSPAFIIQFVNLQRPPGYNVSKDAGKEVRRRMALVFDLRDKRTVEKVKPLLSIERQMLGHRFSEKEMYDGIMVLPIDDTSDGTPRNAVWLTCPWGLVLRCTPGEAINFEITHSEGEGRGVMLGPSRPIMFLEFGLQQALQTAGAYSEWAKLAARDAMPETVAAVQVGLTRHDSFRLLRKRSSLRPGFFSLE